MLGGRGGKGAKEGKKERGENLDLSISTIQPQAVTEVKDELRRERARRNNQRSILKDSPSKDMTPMRRFSEKEGSVTERA